MLKLLIKDNKGGTLPLVAGVLIIFIFLGAYELSSIFIFRDRAIIRDAVDSAVTSSLASGTQVRSKATRFYEEHIVIYDSDEEGNVYVVADYWDPRESGRKNYIYLEKTLAENTAKSYFNRILNETNTKATLVSWNYSVEYDDKRYLDVSQSRHHTSWASSWWISEFGDSSPSSWGSSSQQKQVRFPRYVKASLTVTVQVPIPQGGVFGKSTQNITWTSVAIKEISSNKI